MLKSIATMCLLTPLFAGCQFSGAAGQIEQQLPGVLTASETIAVNTLILRYQELQRLKMVLDGLPVPQLPPLPAQSPVPVVIVPPPTQPPVVVPPVSSSPPANLPLRQKKRGNVMNDQIATENHTVAEKDFWAKHSPSFRLVEGESGIFAAPTATAMLNISQLP